MALLDLPECLPLFERSECYFSMPERQDVGYDGVESARPNELKNVEQVLPLPAIRTANFKLECPDVADVSLWIEAGRRAASEHTRAPAQYFQRRHPCGKAASSRTAIQCWRIAQGSSRALASMFITLFIVSAKR